MELLVQALIFLVAAGVIWYFSGILISAVDKIARRFNKSGFVVAFFVLGFLTSISEISVAVNSTISKVPQVSVGNLIGASFVILLLIVPLLAVLGNGIKLKDTLSGYNLPTALLVVLMPAFMAIDGDVTMMEGILALLGYVVLVFAIRNEPKHPVKKEHIKEDILGSKTVGFTIFKVCVGAVCIFLAGDILVQQSVFFADYFQIPKSLVGLLMLSLGTNIPEIVIAVRAVMERKHGIAFGDYLGSTVTNSATFGLLAIANAPFTVVASEFIFSFVLLLFGLLFFYIFARSKDTISRKEGIVLFCFYLVFFGVQLYHLLLFAT